MEVASGHVLLGVSGGIAAYKAASLVRQLRAHGLEVRCALTRAATRFITPLTLEVLSGHAVYQEEYLDATGSGEELHVVAAQWADLLCVAPATANTLARLAMGLADDFLSTTAVMFEGPLVVAPAMHASMWSKATTQEHIERLGLRRASIVGPVQGALASGEIGQGRMAEPEEIVAEVLGRLRTGALAGRRVLVTAGPTWEPLDPVRFLGNRSSGKMGFSLAGEAARRGAEVTLVAGPVSLETPPGVARVDVKTALEMKEAVHRAAIECDLVIMAAAVADYRPAQTSEQKIKKGDRVPSISLIENPDILASLASVAPAALRVGFAAETESLLENAQEKLRGKDVHFLVANDVSRSDIGFESDHNEVVLLERDGEPTKLDRMSKRELAARLLDIFERRL